ncbi:MAG: hypothetical protein ABL995_20570, partial [Bryobacteraceae bacterium]
MTPSVASARLLALTRDFFVFADPLEWIGAAGFAREADLPDAGALHCTRFFTVVFFATGFFGDVAGVCASAMQTHAAEATIQRESFTRESVARENVMR